MTSHANASGPPRPALRLVFWESTSRCNLRCAHCRRLDADEAAGGDLTGEQARRLIDSAAAIGRPVFVFSGGEPLLRGDWEDLAGYARAKGLPAALATNGTLIDDALAARIAAVGLHRVSVSLDAPEAEAHDALRGVAGAFEAAVAGIRALRRAGVPFQINATVAAGGAAGLDALYALARDLGAVALHLFLLVPVGCGLELPADRRPGPEECEAVLEWLCRRQAEGPLELKATCAPQYYRVARQWLERNADAPGAGRVRAAVRGRGCLAGVGVIFVSHAGEVFPCGYLPVACGNVRRRDLEEIWRDSEPLKKLRDFDRLTGACGVCEYRAVCGGCRARAFSATGDFLAPEPLCPYTPGGGRAQAGRSQ